MSDEYRLDDLARRAGVATTTVRLYRTKGLLPPPRLEGRTGWYDESHLRRLRLIARLQGEGYSLAGIANLLQQWEDGRSLDAVIGVEAQLDELLGSAHAIELGAAELLERFPPGALSPAAIQRAATLGLIEPQADGTVRVADRRFIDSGAALAHLGVPADVILDEWEALVAHTDDVAAQFVAMFEQRLAPSEWRDALTSDGAAELAATLAQLRSAARQVVLAALDASLARAGRDRLGDLVTSLGPTTANQTDESADRAE